MNDINFTGGFLIEKPSKRMWANIEKELPKRKSVFQNYNENGDKFFAIKSVYDKDMAGLILRKGVKFKFYPNINLKTRLDKYFPEEARKTINAQDYVIDTKEGLREFIRNNEVKATRSIIKKYRWKPDDHIEKTLKALELNKDECIIENKSGITYIKNKNGKILAMASPNNVRGVNFVYKYPENSDASSEKFALSQSGEREDFGVFEYKDFLKNFKNNVKIDQHRIRPKNN